VTFKCDNCPATSFLRSNPAVRKQRHHLDPASNRQLSLCNACGLKLKRNQNRSLVEKKDGIQCGGKREYLAAGVSFGQRVARLVGDDAALRFYCPRHRPGQATGCGCLQAFLCGPGGEDDGQELGKRAGLLLRYHSRAQELVAGAGPAGGRSDQFQEFVLTNRDYLKSQLRLCEPAVQRVLLYSNNFLYKARRTGGGRRLEPDTAGSRQVVAVPGGSVLVQHEAACACGAGARLERGKVEAWRTRATGPGGQAARRAVVEEMWRAAGGRLCPALGQLVTGAGLSAIGRLAARLRREADRA
jgi:hypothetical protein